MSKPITFVSLMSSKNQEVTYATYARVKFIRAPKVYLTLEKYITYVEHGQFIRDGQWWVDQYNAVGIATPQEIAIAEEYEHLNATPFNRLDHIE